MDEPLLATARVKHTREIKNKYMVESVFVKPIIGKKNEEGYYFLQITIHNKSICNLSISNLKIKDISNKVIFEKNDQIS